MPQASLAILALLLTTLYSMQRQRDIFDGQMRMVTNEMDMMATSVAKDELERIGVTAFDENVIDAATGSARRLTNPAQLTPSNQFRLEGARWNDLDDFHNGPVERSRVVAGDTFIFRTVSKVAYVRDSDGRTVVTGPTRTKQVTVYVRPITIATRDSIRLQQTFTCGSSCDW